MNRQLLGSRIWINGTLVSVDQAMVSPTDRGFMLGDGLFETMLWANDKVRFFDDHMARLTASCAALGFVVPCGIDAIVAGLNALAADADGAQAALRLTLTRGTGPRGLAIPNKSQSILVASIAPISPAKLSLGLKTVSIARNTSAPSARFKTLSYIDNIMALQEAHASRADDAIMLGTTGNVACASSANLIVRYQGANLTPALEDGALPGIVRGRLIHEGRLEEARISPSFLADCDVAALTNAIIGVRCVTAIDGRKLALDPNWAQSLNDTL